LVVFALGVSQVLSATVLSPLLRRLNVWALRLIDRMYAQQPLPPVARLRRLADWWMAREALGRFLTFALGVWVLSAWWYVGGGMSPRQAAAGTGARYSEARIAAGPAAVVQRVSRRENGGVNVRLAIVNQTKYLHGAHATTCLVNDCVNARLGNYGSAVEEIWITVLYPPKSRTSPATDPFDAEFRRLVKRSPWVTFSRTKRRIDVRCVCRKISARSIAGDGHLSPEEVVLLVATVSEALELIQPRFRPTDEFDFEGFLADARRALARCAGGIRRWLG
jgi:hypothetical protein